MWRQVEKKKIKEHELEEEKRRRLCQTKKYSEFPQPLFHNQNATQSKFLGRVQLVWIQTLPSPKLVALSNLKNPICSVIYL